MSNNPRSSTTDAHRFRAEALRFDSLTPLERNISILVAQGLTNNQISLSLSIDVPTAQAGLDSIFRKLEVSNRLELIVLCYRHRLVVPPAATGSDRT